MITGKLFPDIAGKTLNRVNGLINSATACVLISLRKLEESGTSQALVPKVAQHIQLTQTQDNKTLEFNSNQISSYKNKLQKTKAK